MTFDQLDQVAVGDLTFDVRTLGPDDGEPVVLLHGFPETSLSWSAVAPMLADAGYRVIAPDQRGYSATARPEAVADYTMDHLVDDVLGLADALDLGTFHLVGHDWGAAVSWAVAAHHPDRLRTLTAVSVPHLAAYNAALRGDSDQQERSAYIGLMREEGKAEDVLGEDDGRRLRAMYDGKIPASHVDAYIDFFHDRDSPHRRSRLVPRHDGGTRRPALGVGADDVCLERRRLGDRTHVRRGVRRAPDGCVRFRRAHRHQSLDPRGGSG